MGSGVGVDLTVWGYCMFYDWYEKSVTKFSELTTYNKKKNKNKNKQAKKVMLFYGVGASAPCTLTRSTFTSLLAIENLCIMVSSHVWMIRTAPFLTSCGTVALNSIFE